MTVNKYASDWVTENYDFEEDKFYTNHARYTVYRKWAKGFEYHTITCFVIAFLLSLLVDQVEDKIALFFCTGAIMGVAFLSYALCAYGAGHTARGTSTYIVFIFSTFHFLNSLNNRGLMNAISLAASLVYIAAACYFIFKAWTIKREMKEDVKAKEARDDQKEQEAYNNARRADYEATHQSESCYEQEYAYQNQYQQQSYEAPKKEVNPKQEEAMKLFEGYDTDAKTLKIRYRELARKYHPDHGGDTELMTFINNAYEELKKKLGSAA